MYMRLYMYTCVVHVFVFVCLHGSWIQFGGRQDGSLSNLVNVYEKTVTIPQRTNANALVNRKTTLQTEYLPRTKLYAK